MTSLIKLVKISLCAVSMTVAAYAGNMLVITENSSTDLTAVYNGSALTVTNLAANSWQIDGLPHFFVDFYFSLAWLESEGGKVNLLSRTADPLLPNTSFQAGPLYFKSDVALADLNANLVPFADGFLVQNQLLGQTFFPVYSAVYTDISVIDRSESPAVADVSNTGGLMTLALCGLLVLRRRFLN